MSDDARPTFPMERTDPFAPPDEYGRMRADGALVRANLPNGAPVWVVTRYAEARQILGDPRISSQTGRPDRPRGEGDDQPNDGFFIERDPPAHTRIRRLLLSELGARPIAAMRPQIQRIVDAAIDEMLDSGAPADLVGLYARRVPARVSCALFGIPDVDRAFIETRLRRLSVTTMNPSLASQATRDVRRYLRKLIDAPHDGLIPRLAKHLATGALTADELIDMGLLMLLAGYDSPANSISLGMLTLLRHPAQLAALRADEGLLAGAIEEMVRFNTIQDWVSFDREATADMEVGGVRLRAGDRLIVLASSANRDARQFERPDEFDIHRAPRQHLGFGHGIHQCVGHNLARAELQIAFGTLLARIPTLRLAVEPEELPFSYDAPFFGLHEMPVTW